MSLFAPFGGKGLVCGSEVFGASAHGGSKAYKEPYENLVCPKG